jgi:nucleoid-associated protein YgaU
MAKKAGVTKQKSLTQKSAKKETGFWEYFRFGESYTSLILGIIVVIIATALLLSFIHNKNAHNVNVPISQQTQNTVQISQKALDLAKTPPQAGDIDGTITIAPTDTIAPTIIPTAIPTAVPTVQPTVRPTVQPKPTMQPKPTQKPRPTLAKRKLVKSNPTPTVVPQVKTDKDNNIWIVQKGESLWTIAEKKYTSGYNWVDIAKANKLADPSDIHVGDRLILPSVEPKATTIVVKPSVVPVAHVSNDQKNTTIVNNNNTNKITGNSYTVARGDNLWNIAVRAYGDGYKWTTIAQANNLASPGVIFSGNHLKIPRG